MRGQIDPAGYGKKKKWPPYTHDGPGRTESQRGLDDIIDEVRDEVVSVIFQPGRGIQSDEWNWFEGAKRCNIKDIMEAASLIETAKEMERETEIAKALEGDPSYDVQTAWARVRDKFQDAVDRNCDCQRWM